MTGKQHLGLWLLIGPTIMLIDSLLLYALTNWVLSFTNNGPSIFTAIINIALFIIGTIGVIAWLPGVVIGIVFLATGGKNHAQN